MKLNPFCFGGVKGYAYHPNGNTIWLRGVNQGMGRYRYTVYNMDLPTCDTTPLYTFYKNSFSPSTSTKINHSGQIFTFNQRDSSIYFMKDINDTLNYLFKPEFYNDRSGFIFLDESSINIFRNITFDIFEYDNKTFKLKNIITPKIPISSLTKVHVDCDSNYLLATAFDMPIELYLDSIQNHRTIFSFMTEYTRLVVYDLKNNQEIKEICKIKLPFRNSGIGIINPTEFLATDPNCDLLLDLDRDNSSGLFPYDYNFPLSLCIVNDTASLCDEDLYLHTSSPLDSIKISLSSPDLGLGEDIISLGLPLGFNLNKKSDTIWILNKTNGSDAEYTQAIKSLRYVGLSGSRSSGIRRIELLGFHPFRQGIPVYVFIKVGSQQYAGRDTVIRICNQDNIIDLNSYLSTSQKLGIWIPSLSSSGSVFDTRLDSFGRYQYILTDEFCKSDTASIDLIKINPPIIDLGNDTSICGRIDFELSIDSLLFTDIRWNGVKSSHRHRIHSPGIYTFSGITEDGCIVVDNIVVNKLNDFISQLQQEKLCPDIKFNYKGKAYSAGETVLDTIAAFTGCDTLLSIELIPVPSPALSISGDSLICFGDKSILTGTGFGSLRWNNGDSSAVISANPGIYTLTVTDANGCTNTAAYLVRQAPEIIYDVEPYDPMCSGDFGRIVVQGSGGISPVRFFLNGIESRSGLFDQLTPGWYILRITDLLGCEKTDTIQILPASAFDVDITNMVELDEGSSVLIKYQTLAGNLRNLQILPDDGGIVIEGIELRIFGQEDREYTIRFIDEQGCVIERKLLIRIRRNIDIHVPNAFSPNGDQINDFWQPVIGNAWNLRSASVYDRWGALVFHSSIDPVSWDGRSKGQNLMPGVYVWHLSLRSFSGEDKEMYGEMTLIR